MSRMAVLATVAMTLGSLLTVRLWFLQAIDAGGLQERVREVRTRTVKITPERAESIMRCTTTASCGSSLSCWALR